jgi:hypothetical protein
MGKKAGAPALPQFPAPTPLTPNEILGLEIDARTDAENKAKALIKSLAVCERPCTLSNLTEKIGQPLYGKAELLLDSGQDAAPNPGLPAPPGPWIHIWSKQLWVVKAERDFKASWACTRG